MNVPGTSLILSVFLWTAVFFRIASAQSLQPDKNSATLNQEPTLDPRIYEIKARFLALFPDYFKWPSDSVKTRSFTIGILGQDPFGDKLDKAIDGKLYEGKRMHVKRSADIEALTACQMIFFSKARSVGCAALLARLNAEAVVTVGETDDFLRQGGAIVFIVDGSKVRYEINRKAFKQGEIEVDLRLLPMNPVRVR